MTNDLDRSRRSEYKGIAYYFYSAGCQAKSDADPVVFWCGWPFLVRGAKSFRSLNLNMFSLIAVGTLAAYGFSLVVLLMPGVIPRAFDEHGVAPLYFEAAAVIITLVLMG